MLPSSSSPFYFNFLLLQLLDVDLKISFSFVAYQGTHISFYRTHASREVHFFQLSRLQVIYTTSFQRY